MDRGVSRGRETRALAQGGRGPGRCGSGAKGGTADHAGKSTAAGLLGWLH